MDTDKLITDNMGLVYAQLKHFNRLNDDEAYGWAVEALINAARTYDDSKSVKFSTYAMACIYNGIAMYLRKMRKKQREVSYDAEVPDTDVTLRDIIPDSGPTPDEIYLEKELQYVVCKAIDKVLSEMSNQTSVGIIEYWRDTGFTARQADIAAALGIAQPTVSRALSAFKYRIKCELEGYVCGGN